MGMFPCTPSNPQHPFFPLETTFTHALLTAELGAIHVPLLRHIEFSADDYVSL